MYDFDKMKGKSVSTRIIIVIVMRCIATKLTKFNRREIKKQARRSFVERNFLCTEHNIFHAQRINELFRKQTQLRFFWSILLI